jgi:hypothetical protein
MVSSFLRFLDHTQWRTTVCRNPLDERSARRRDIYLTTHNTHNKHPCPRWDMNPRFQQASGRRPTPSARPLGPASYCTTGSQIKYNSFWNLVYFVLLTRNLQYPIRRTGMSSYYAIQMEQFCFALEALKHEFSSQIVSWEPSIFF